MTYSEIRKKFIEFFAENQPPEMKHREVASSPLIPFDDPTLLFINAGMNQFKDVFVGKDKREYSRAVSIQKCLRAGGKHNDLENVGFTKRHHTFFEMMGNFSFGDYFKEDAIHLAWKFLTEVLQIPKERLYVTVYLTDDEAAKIWQVQENVPEDRIFRYGEKDNFWRMGATGPCGPCSEIFYDHNPDGPKIPIDQDEERFVEIWNLVFMQFFESEDGTQTPLPKPSVDTGAGLERIAAVMQGHSDNYKSDVFAPIIKQVCEYSGLPTDWAELENTQETLSALKVVADHARAVSLLISEGVLPGNEGRSYVLRRIMRRAIRYGRKLSTEKSIFPFACAAVIQHMGGPYPALTEKREAILKAILDEEKRFLQTLDKGSDLLIAHIEKLKGAGQKTVDGKMAFTLYDTYGFPVDLTELIAKEHNMGLDSQGFDSFMQNAKDKAKAASKNYSISSGDQHFTQWSQEVGKEHLSTTFLGYDKTESPSKVLALSNGEKAVPTLSGSGWMICDQTPFYAKGGGQVGDQGLAIFSGEGGQPPRRYKVKNCIQLNGIYLHAVDVGEKSISVGDTLNLQVDDFSRQETANNHSATHLLHAALRDVLGDHVKQAGSQVTPSKLRFDFTHTQPVTEQELLQIENLVNQQISDDIVTDVSEMPYQKAVDEGALAMFGEKYTEHVRVVQMGDFSKELCGGTHVLRTSQIRLFKVFAETGVSAGVRRIEAITGRSAYVYLNGLAEENKNLRRKLNVALPNNFLEGLDNQLNDKVEDLMAKQGLLEKKLAKAQTESVSIDDLLAMAEEKIIKGQQGHLLMTRVPIPERKILSDVVDKLRHKRENIVVVLVGDTESKTKPMIVGVSKALNNVHAGEITKQLCALMEGKGGGRADFSQGSITDLSGWNQAKEKLSELVQ